MIKAWTSALEAYVLTANERYALEGVGEKARVFFLSQRMAAEDRTAAFTDIAALPDWAFYDTQKQAHLARICGLSGCVSMLKSRPDGALMRQVAKLMGVRALDYLLSAEDIASTPTNIVTLDDGAVIAIAGYQVLRDAISANCEDARLKIALNALSFQYERATAA